VLRLTRLQTGRNKFEPAPGDLDALCGRVVADLAELPGNGDRIHYTCSPRPLPAVFDARLLQQALANLLHNALKFSPPDKVVRVTLARADGPFTLRLADEGIGIPPEDLPHLFEPFHRAANVGVIHGTGLGLAIAKEAVELHGGTIGVESQVGVGTAFTVTLPDSAKTA
jgi:signal transduction histidine kinase